MKDLVVDTFEASMSITSLTISASLYLFAGTASLGNKLSRALNLLKGDRRIIGAFKPTESIYIKVSNHGV